MSHPDTPTETVRTMLRAAGLTPTPEELDRIAGWYPVFRRAVDELYTGAACREELSALDFDAAETAPPWT